MRYAVSAAVTLAALASAYQLPPKLRAIYDAHKVRPPARLMQCTLM